MFEIVDRVKNPVAVPAQISRRTHTVKEQRVFALVFVGIVLMLWRINGGVRNPAAIQLRE